MFHESLLDAWPDACADLRHHFGLAVHGVKVAVAVLPHFTRPAMGPESGPILPISIAGSQALVGPLWVPTQTACPDCLDHWLTASFFDMPASIDIRWATTVRLASSYLASGHPLALALLAGQLGSSALGISDGVDRVTLNAVVPRRDCPACGELQKSFSSLRDHCSPWTGVISRVEATDQPVAGAFRATAFWSSPMPRAGARRLLRRQRSFGRGRSPSAAEAGCIGESIERYSLIYRGDEQLIRRRFGELDAIHPNKIQLYSPLQYETRSAWNATADEDFHVPEPFDECCPVEWLEALEVGSHKGTRHVPAACCLMWYQGTSGEPEFARADTVGCASARSYDEALTSALLEWVERDATAIWWDNQVKRPAVCIESFGSPDMTDIQAALVRLGRQLVLLDCTTDVGIPVYVAVAPRLDGTEPLVAAACDLDPRVAGYRAASEVGQVWFEAKRSRALDSSMSDWLMTQSTATQPQLVPSGYIDAPPPSACQLTEGEVRWKSIVERIESVGLKVYAVDHSRPDVLLRTVRAIVPGLRHVWNRRAPGRLYDVPLSLGWLTRPKLEIELNQVRCML